MIFREKVNENLRLWKESGLTLWIWEEILGRYVIKYIFVNLEKFHGLEFKLEFKYYTFCVMLHILD